MARVFFNIRLDDAYLPERTGQCVADLDEARALACTIIRALVAQHGGEPRLLNAAVAVTDETGAPAFELSFLEAIYGPVAAPAAAPARRPPRRRPSLAARIRAGLARAAAGIPARRAALERLRDLASAAAPRLRPLRPPHTISA
ncbi:DUF6894 family protein [Methylobacterium nigriterrae]|uniref:DUF6894 family protein n=1 Tax=Methylobacterium nigriterrae TaxID=3127512 RepID=UPI0030140C26